MELYRWLVFTEGKIYKWLKLFWARERCGGTLSWLLLLLFVCLSGGDEWIVHGSGDTDAVVSGVCGSGLRWRSAVQQLLHERDARLSCSAHGTQRRLEHVYWYSAITIQWLNIRALHLKPNTELQSITCHMGSHSVTCHPNVFLPLYSWLPANMILHLLT